MDKYVINETQMTELVKKITLSDMLTIGLCLLCIAATILSTLLVVLYAHPDNPDLLPKLFSCSVTIFSTTGLICTFWGWYYHTDVKILLSTIRSQNSKKDPN